jgi:hypothetical protein
MMTQAPRIGFDRFIAPEWATTALKIRAELAQPEDLETLLDAAGLGAAARTKTRTVLKRLWLEPRVELVDFADRGAAIFKAHPKLPVAAMHWGMAIAAYPFFGKVAELIGRLSALQGDCTSAEIHRRMSEIYGEREGTYRMTNMVIQSQAGWATVARTEKGKRVCRLAPIVIDDDELTAWLVEAVLRYAGKPQTISSLQSQPTLFPFNLTPPMAYLASNSEHLVTRSDGTRNQFVALRDRI